MTVVSTDTQKMLRKVANMKTLTILCVCVILNSFFLVGFRAEGKVTTYHKPCPDGRKVSDNWQVQDKCELCSCLGHESYQCHTCQSEHKEGEYPDCCLPPKNPNNCGLGRKLNDVWTEPGCTQCTCHASGVHCHSCRRVTDVPGKIITQHLPLEFPKCCPHLVDSPLVEEQESPRDHPRIHKNCQGDIQMTGNWTETGCLGCYCDKSGAVCLGCPIVETDIDLKPDPSLEFPHCCPEAKK